MTNATGLDQARRAPGMTEEKENPIPDHNFQGVDEYVPQVLAIVKGY